MKKVQNNTNCKKIHSTDPSERQEDEVFLFSIKSRSFGGDIGKDVGLIPSASVIAFPTAAIVGTTGTSPTPRNPNGCNGFGTSTILQSIIGASDATGIL